MQLLFSSSLSLKDFILLWVLGHFVGLFAHPWLFDHLIFFLCLGFCGVLALIVFLPNRRFGLSALLLSFILGISFALWSLSLAANQRLSQDQHGQVFELVGQVDSFVQETQTGLRFELKVNHMLTPGAEEIERVRVSVFKDRAVGVTQAPLKIHNLVPGASLRLTLKLKEPRGLANPAGFDYGRWLMMRSIHALGQVKESCFKDAICQVIQMPSRGLWGLRLVITERWRGLLVDYPLAAQLLNALWVADKGGLNEDLGDGFNRLGLGHLLAISGLHIGMVAAIGAVVGKILWKMAAGLALVSGSERLWASLSASVLAAVYAALAGFSLPTSRALIMLGLSVFYLLWVGKVKASDLLILGLGLICLLMPLSPLGVGFWLSFVAVALLMLLFAARLPAVGLFKGLLLSQVLLGFVLMLWLLPEQGIQPLSLLVNLIMIPLVQFVLLPFSMWVFMSGFGANELGLGLAWLLNFIIELASWSEVLRLSLPVSVLVAQLLGLSLLLLLVSRLRPFWYLAPVGLLAVAFNQAPAVKFGEVNVVLFDVGQGLSALIQTRSHNLLYDTGPAYFSGWDAGEAVILPYLQQHSVSHLDRVLISHMDKDHSGGLTSLLEKVPVGELLVVPSAPGLVALPGNIQPCEAGLSWVWDGVRFEVIHPAPAVRVQHLRQRNNLSCVLRVQDQRRTFLFSGDIEASAEAQLIARHGHSLKADVLIAPHHGSKTSSTTGFINHVAPNWVIFTHGYKNAYGHPHPSVQRRYLVRGVNLLSTSTSGAIFFNQRENPLLTRQQFDYAWY